MGLPRKVPTPIPSPVKPVPSIPSATLSSVDSVTAITTAPSTTNPVSPSPPAMASENHQEHRRKQKSWDELGKSCGRWTCYTSDIKAIRRRDGWFEGRLITVIAEFLAARLGEQAQAQHTTPLVLWNVRELLDKRGSGDSGSLTKAWIRKEINIVQNSGSKRHWVIPAHVPGHWTLIGIDWESKHIQFMDSMPSRLGAEDDELRVQEEVWHLLGLVCTEYVHDEWKWFSEEHPARQKNGYDCGAFVLADMAAFFTNGAPSQLTQDDMKAWRSEINSILDGLHGLTYIKVVTDPDDPVLVIDD
ncbi:hypothetical protein M422DRAFT_270223 [Sphaerobolus stellatus SS14]|uniref:Ubiquitin-like protease family profile domain-containing protein n=1 Tax=Sphaerobolus stellatus (strain SS14) TaxID=990650 RepID=A0A0C9UT11_SPHS4|nr:hypothetical protein M422DRAFT_270223 [Sphaerobolus stellatus SS14]